MHVSAGWGILRSVAGGPVAASGLHVGPPSLNFSLLRGFTATSGTFRLYREDLPFRLDGFCRAAEAGADRL